MKYMEFLKKHESFDKYILFLLSLNFGVSDVARMVGMSRQAIYDVINRNEDIVKEFIESVQEVLEGDHEA